MHLINTGNSTNFTAVKLWNRYGIVSFHEINIGITFLLINFASFKCCSLCKMANCPPYVLVQLSSAMKYVDGGRTMYPASPIIVRPGCVHSEYSGSFKYKIRQKIYFTFSCFKDDLQVQSQSFHLQGRLCRYDCTSQFGREFRSNKMLPVSLHKQREHKLFPCFPVNKTNVDFTAYVYFKKF